MGDDVWAPPFPIDARKTGFLGVIPCTERANPHQSYGWVPHHVYITRLV